jgi:hypothetical protein
MMAATFFWTSPQTCVPALLARIFFTHLALRPMTARGAPPPRAPCIAKQMPQGGGNNRIT